MFYHVVWHKVLEIWRGVVLWREITGLVNLNHLLLSSLCVSNLVYLINVCLANNVDMILFSMYLNLFMRMDNLICSIPKFTLLLEFFCHFEISWCSLAFWEFIRVFDRFTWVGDDFGCSINKLHCCEYAFMTFANI